MASRYTVGQMYINQASVSENITGRLLSGPEGRERFFANEKGKLSPGLKKALLESLQIFFGPTVHDIRISYSAKAGCGMCPCSPGFNVTVDENSHHEYLPMVYDRKPRERLNFQVGMHGKVVVRMNGYSPKYWGSRVRRGEGVPGYEICTLLPVSYKPIKTALSFQRQAHTFFTA